MIRSYLLLLVPLGFAIGYVTGLLEQPTSQSLAPSQTEAPISSVKSNSSDSKRAHWRQQFLAILEEPSAALRTASFYAFAQNVPTREMPYALEAIYPEGWVSYRGDAPLALVMEWATQDPITLSAELEYLNKTYPNIGDNLEGVIFNLGLQNASGALATLENLSDAELKNTLSLEFINGLEREHPQLLFQTRLSLLGPQTTLNNLSKPEFELAILSLWQNPEFYAQQNVAPPPWISLELGKRYGLSYIEKLNTDNYKLFPLIGHAISQTDLPPNIQQLLLANWQPRYELRQLLSDQETTQLLQHLTATEGVWEKLSFNHLSFLWDKGLTRELADRLLSQANTPPHIRSSVLNSSAQFYPPDEYLALLSAEPRSNRSNGIASLLNQLSDEEGILMLQSIPPDWIDPITIKRQFNRFVVNENRTALEAMISRFGPLSENLSNDYQFSRQLWNIAPDLYLQSIAALDEIEQRRHLSRIAQTAHEEELPSLFENSTLEQQTNVLIDLIHIHPELSVEILKDEDPSQISPSQASRIGDSLATHRSSEVANEFFKSRPMTEKSDQIALVTYYLSKLDDADEIQSTQKIATLSPQHDYLHRMAKAFLSQANEIATLASLKQENPQSFLNNLSAVLQYTPGESLVENATRLLSSPYLSKQERMQIHKSLYGAPEI